MNFNCSTGISINDYAIFNKKNIFSLNFFFILPFLLRSMEFFRPIVSQFDMVDFISNISAASKCCPKRFKNKIFLLFHFLKVSFSVWIIEGMNLSLIKNVKRLTFSIIHVHTIGFRSQFIIKIFKFLHRCTLYLRY